MTKLNGMRQTERAKETIPLHEIQPPADIYESLSLRVSLQVLISPDAGTFVISFRETEKIMPEKNILGRYK